MKEEILNIIKNKEMISTEEIMTYLNEDINKIKYYLELLAAEEKIKKQDINGKIFWIINRNKKSDQLKIWELMKQKGII